MKEEQKQPEIEKSFTNQMVKSIYPFFKNIDWEKVKDYKYEFQQSGEFSKPGQPTKLNLEASVVKNIIDIQKYFQDNFNAARVYRAFVIRMVVKASYLLRTGEVNILKAKS